MKMACVVFVSALSVLILFAFVIVLIMNVDYAMRDFIFWFGSFCSGACFAFLLMGGTTLLERWIAKKKAAHTAKEETTTTA